MSEVTTCLWHHEAGPDDAGLIVMVHGAMDRSASFVRVSRALADRYRVLRYDRRGYARSLACGGAITMGQHVADLLTLVDGRQAVVLGHSYGGNIAVAAATQAPNIRGVVTYENPLSWLDWWSGSSRRVDPDAPGAVVAERFMRRVVGDEIWEALPESVKQQRRDDGDTLIAELVDLRNEPWRAADVRVPIVAMYGERTAERHRRGAEVMADIGGRGAAIAVTGAGHNGPATHPQPVAAAVAELATAVGLSASPSSSLSTSPSSSPRS